VRANFVPALMLQAVMVALLIAYYVSPATRDLLDQLAALKARWGFGYSAVAAIIAGAVVPELLRVVVFQSGRVSRGNLRNLVFTVPFWCSMGVIVDVFYRAQGGWFGTDASVATVLKKVLVDQFIYNPVFAAPVGAWLYDWKNSGYSMAGTRRFFTAAYYRQVVAPILFATWGVWIPVVTVLYSLPSLLQVPLFALALSMWVILYTWISEQRLRGDVA
jgi:hypothetical protein